MEADETLKQVIKTAEGLGWSVQTYESHRGIDVTFSQFSSLGQDFSFDITVPLDADVSDYAEAVERYVDGYDPDEEALLWVDSFGHGKNGAPYRLRDILDDMEECEQMMETLSDALYKL